MKLLGGLGPLRGSGLRLWRVLHGVWLKAQAAQGAQEVEGRAGVVRHACGEEDDDKRRRRESGAFAQEKQHDLRRGGAATGGGARRARRCGLLVH
eukprot:807255-Prymnesium_polylepis.1